MKNALAITLLLLSMLAWAMAQQPGTPPQQNSGQAASPSSQTGEDQSQPSTRGSADQSGAQDQNTSTHVTEGCLGGSDPNYTLTDKSGVTYKLNMPPNADASKLASHVGESIQVQGETNDSGKAGNGSINVQRIGRGTGT